MPPGITKEINRQIRDGVPIETVDESNFLDYESAKKWVESRSSFNPTHARTNPRNFHEKILRIGEALKMTFV